jgi:hypothetical protein
LRARLPPRMPTFATFYSQLRSYWITQINSVRNCVGEPILFGCLFSFSTVPPAALHLPSLSSCTLRIPTLTYVCSFNPVLTSTKSCDSVSEAKKITSLHASVLESSVQAGTHMRESGLSQTHQHVMCSLITLIGASRAILPTYYVVCVCCVSSHLSHPFVSQKKKCFCITLGSFLTQYSLWFLGRHVVPTTTKGGRFSHKWACGTGFSACFLYHPLDLN